jgi:Rrf2 family protein
LKFSTKTRYGIRAVLEIALHAKTKGIYQKEIATNQELSYKYLDHIINALKVAGIVTKAGGSKSGYILTRDPSEITVYDVHRAFEPGICVVDCLAVNFNCNREDICVLKDFWGNLNTQVIDYFKSTSIKDLMDQQLALTKKKAASKE